MSFERPDILYLLILLPALLLMYWWYLRWRTARIRKIGNSELIRDLMFRDSDKRRWIKYSLQLLGITFLILGIANLRQGSKEQKVSGESAEVIICFDVSNSMLAEDVKPNRLTQAKFTASELIEKLAANKVGLVVFAGNSYVQMPLTRDARAAMMYLNTINTTSVPTQGTAIGSAIETAMLSFENGGEKDDKKGRAIIIITDGESHDDNAEEMAKKAASEGIKIITLGVGTSTGGPIPLRKNNNIEGFKKDRSGNIVLTKLNEQMLNDLATDADGVYMNLAEGKRVIQEVYKTIDELDKTVDGDFEFTEYVNHFQLFLGIGLFLLILEFLMTDKKPKWVEKIDLFDDEKK